MLQRVDRTVEAAEEEEGGGGGGEATNEEEEQEEGGARRRPAVRRPPQAEGPPVATGRQSVRIVTPHAQRSSLRPSRAAMSALLQRAPRQRRGASRCQSSCRAGLQEWILRPQLGRAASRSPSTA